ncbi:hypothetical protein UG55_103811 [Frankia sp. EI5c]|nr:hypothetical protein UG55_103811 [Frankia sp. EI5c]
MSALRLLRLRPWLIREVIPPRRIGTYQLHRDDAVTYIGRSDTDLRRRLIQHAEANRGDFFTFDVHHTREQAFVIECAHFHNTKGFTSNLIHPAAPSGEARSCPFCRGVANARLRLPGTRPAARTHR